MKSENNDLGLVILECRPLPVKEYRSKTGQGNFWFSADPLLFVVGMLFTNYIIAKMANATGPVLDSIFWSVLLVSFVVCGYGMGVWWFLVRPKRDFLILYEKGIQWKLYLGKWDIWLDSGEGKYENIETISYRSDFIDGKSKVAEDKNGEVNENFLFDLFYQKGDLHIVFNNGKVRTIENILKRFDSSDIKKLFEYLTQSHPNLIETLEK